MADFNSIRDKIAVERTRFGRGTTSTARDANTMKDWINDLTSYIPSVNNNGGILCNCQCNSGSTPDGGKYIAATIASAIVNPISTKLMDDNINLVKGCYTNCHGNCYSNCHSNCHSNCRDNGGRDDTD